MNKRELGSEGEQIASNFLKNKGFKIVGKNWTSRWCEIDLITVEDNVLVFIEVKYRKNLKYGSGIEAITAKKMKALVYSANKYISRNKLYRLKYRIDVVVIDVIDEKKEIKYFRNITDYFLSTRGRV